MLEDTNSLDGAYIKEKSFKLETSSAVCNYGLSGQHRDQPKYANVRPEKNVIVSRFQI